MSEQRAIEAEARFINDGRHAVLYFRRPITKCPTCGQTVLPDGGFSPMIDVDDSWAYLRLDRWLANLDARLIPNEMTSDEWRRVRVTVTVLDSPPE